MPVPSVSSSRTSEPLTSEPEPVVCQAPPPPAPPAEDTTVERRSSSVLFCKRDANISLADVNLNPLHLKHHWLKTATKEGGLGAVGGGIPGRGGPPDLPGTPTSINDHAAEQHGPGTECVPLPNTDEQCVNEHLRFGQHMGPWLPAVNDCQTFVKRVVDECTPNAPETRDPRLLESKGIQ